MDFQNFVDGFATMTCLLSVEKKEDGTCGDIRIVAGNRLYMESISKTWTDENQVKEFVPDSLYTEYIPKDLNFETFCFQCAFQKMPLHSYVHPDRYDFWINFFMMPVACGDEKKAYCTYSQEFTYEAETEKMTKLSHGSAERVLNACIKLRGSTDFKESCAAVIKDIRQMCDANYCCILLMDTIAEKCSVLCEAAEDRKDWGGYNADWFSPDFYEIAKTWQDIIGGSNCLILKNKSDMEYIKSLSPIWYESMKKSNVNSLVLFPIKDGCELLGYIWATNFDTNYIISIKETLELTTFFIGSEISNHQLFDRLRVLSTMDMLTGLLNRNEMNNRVDQLSLERTPHKTNIGVIFADLNGLKTMNDNFGHEAGAQLIKTAAYLLTCVFSGYEIYRAGGDEFMVLMRATSNEEMQELCDKLKKLADEGGKASFATGFCLIEDSRNIRIAMRLADEHMYADKNLFYENHPERKRR